MSTEEENVDSTLLKTNVVNTRKSSRFRDAVKKKCTKKLLHRRLPILTWLPKYDAESAVQDLVSGVTVGLTLIPQSLAHAGIAGLPPQYGLYGSFLGCIVYIFLGSCKDVSMGPTATLSIIVFQSVHGMGPKYATLLCLLSGIVEVLMGLLGLGFLIDFISAPVSSGFTSAVALLIVTSQFKDLFGIKLIGVTFIEQLQSAFENIPDARIGDAVLGMSSIAILLFWKFVPDIKAMFTTKNGAKGNPGKVQVILDKAGWLSYISRYAILVVIFTIVSYHCYIRGSTPFTLIGNIPQGLPQPELPPFSVTKNGTYAGFGEMVSVLSTGIIVVPLIAMLENIAICKAFADGKSVDATQELVAVGLCNIATSFFQGYPITGALARSSVNHSCGVRTTMGGLYTALLVIFALVFLTPYFYYIPRTVLAAVLIAAVVFVVDVKVLKPIWRSKKIDLVPGLVTFVACLVLPLETGILIGVAVNLLYLLYQAARPKVTIEKLVSPSGFDYLMLTPDRSLYFPSVEYIRNTVTKHSVLSRLPVVIDCTFVSGSDYTAAAAVEDLGRDFAARRQHLIFFNPRPKVLSVFRGLGRLECRVCCDQEELDTLLKEAHKEVVASGMSVL